MSLTVLDWYYDFYDSLKVTLEMENFYIGYDENTTNTIVNFRQANTNNILSMSRRFTFTTTKFDDVYLEFETKGKYFKQLSQRDNKIYVYLNGTKNGVPVHGTLIYNLNFKTSQLSISNL